MINSRKIHNPTPPQKKMTRVHMITHFQLVTYSIILNQTSLFIPIPYPLIPPTKPPPEDAFVSYKPTKDCLQTIKMTCLATSPMSQYSLFHICCSLTNMKLNRHLMNHSCIQTRRKKFEFIQI